MPNKYLDSVGLAEYTSLIKGELAPKASPAFTGTPTAPTPTAGDDSTKIATTEFVNDAIDTEITSEIAAEVTRADGKYLPFAGGTLTGVVNGVTPTAGDDSTKLATTEYVQEEIRTHANMPIGHEYFTMNPNIPQGSLPLFGGEYSRETYADLWAWVQQQTGYFITDSAWQAMANSQSGNVPFYSDGDGSTTFRVPSLKCWVKGANGTVSEVGSYKAAGLPNITGSFGHSATLANKSDTYTGAFSWNSLSQNRYGSTTAINDGGTMEINASRSSSIYGNSNTVQPESIVGMWLVKAYGTVVDTGQIDEQQYIDDRIAALPNTFLPLTGGALTGDLTISGKLLGSNSNNTATLFFVGNSRSGCDGYTGLYGANSYNNGASIFMYGKNHEAAGRFDIHAFDGTNRKTLFGNANGSLIWNGKEVERVYASGTNYIRFEGGLQICWGYTTATTAGSTVTFPVAFRSTGYVMMVQVYGSSLGSGLSNKTTTSVKVYSSHATVQAGLDWIAIGLWK